MVSESPRVRDMAKQHALSQLLYVVSMICYNDVYINYWCNSIITHFIVDKHYLV